MRKAIEYLKARVSGKVVGWLLIAATAVYLTMLLYTLPAVERFAPGRTLFDLSPAGYSYETAIALLDALGAEGRNVYLTLQLPVDFIYPGLFAVSCALLLIWLFGKCHPADSKIFYFAIVPVMGGVFDYLENLSIVGMIKSYPDVATRLVDMASTFTILKSGFTTLFFLLLLLGGFQLIKRRVSGARSNGR